MPKPKYLMWDFDNTLAYRDGMWTQTIYELCRESGFNIASESIKPYLAQGFPWHNPKLSHEEFFNGLSWWEHMNKHFLGILLQLGLEQKEAGSIAKNIRERYIDIRRWHLFDDTASVLKSTAEIGYKSVIVSNHVPELPILAEQLGLTEFIENIFNSADMGYEKPNPKIFEHALGALANVTDVTMIGDSFSSDIIGAEAVGIRGILVRSPNINNHPRYSQDLYGILPYLS